MRVLVTGATGFVGFHSARELLQAGHTVRLGARSEAKARSVFGEDLSRYELALGDVTDAAAVKAAVQDCDAVIHTAALVSMEANDRQRMLDTNLGGTQRVISEALEAGVKHIVYVSSISVFEQPPSGQYDETSPYASSGSHYGESKIAANQWVRERIAEGAPIAISYPTGIIGPDDPGLSESNEAFQYFLNTSFVDTSSGLQMIDVRDLAEVHRLLIEGEHRGDFIVGGYFQPWRDLGDRLEKVLGRRILRLPIPGPVLRAMGAANDVIRRFIPYDSIFTADAMHFATRAAEGRNDKLLASLDFQFRPPEQTLHDLIYWMSESGHIARKWQSGLTKRDDLA